MFEQTNIPLPAIENRLTDFVFLPDYFCFGADLQMTVISGYLRLDPQLVENVKARRTTLQEGEPVALIVAYDVEEKSIELHCVNCYDTQCAIALHNIEQMDLYMAMSEAIQKRHKYKPEAILNYVRRKAGLPALD